MYHVHPAGLPGVLAAAVCGGVGQFNCPLSLLCGYTNAYIIIYIYDIYIYTHVSTYDHMHVCSLSQNAQAVIFHVS